MKDIKRLTNNEYEFVYKRAPRFCLDFVVKIGGKLLLTKRNIKPYKDTWHLPGGRVFYKESFNQAAKRIIKNELGINFSQKLKLIGLVEYLRDGEYIHSISAVFLLKLPENVLERIKVDKKQASGFNIFSKFPNKTHPVQRRFLEKEGLL